MKEFFNCFIGFPLSFEFKHELEIIQRKLQSYMPSASIIDPASAHITLYYLGKQTTKDLEDISNILYEEQDIIHGEEIEVGDTGIFYRNSNSENKPYVLYLKVTHTDKLLTLKNHLASHLDSYNKDDERSFVPHLTLGRLKTTESEIQFNENKKLVDNLLSMTKWKFKLREIYIYGTANPDSSKFQDILFKIPLI